MIIIKIGGNRENNESDKSDNLFPKSPFAMKLVESCVFGLFKKIYELNIQTIPTRLKIIEIFCGDNFTIIFCNLCLNCYSLNKVQLTIMPRELGSLWITSKFSKSIWAKKEEPVVPDVDKKPEKISRKSFYSPNTKSNL